MNGQYDLIGMVRKNDHSTSIAAAGRVRRRTCEERVTEIAHKAASRGFIDDDLKAAWPDLPESSLRKRRTTMTQQNVIIDTGRTPGNRFGQQEKVWAHRDYVYSPPPVVELEPNVSKADQIVRLEAQVRDLQDIAALALPYVEDSIDDDLFSQDGRERTQRLVDRIKSAVETKGKDEE